jgi:uncharacterized OB-fold protein
MSGETKGQSGRRIFPPAVTPETQRFWDAAREGKLLFGFCLDCSEPHYFPRNFCPFCFSERVEWRQASGNATVYSYSIMRRTGSPYAIAYVTLAEGPTLLTNIVDCDLENIKIGGPTKLVWKETEGGPPIPFFTLI